MVWCKFLVKVGRLTDRSQRSIFWSVSWINWNFIAHEENNTAWALEVEWTQMTFLFILSQIAWYCVLLWKMTLWQQATDCKASWHGPPVCLSLSWASPEMPDCWPRAEGVKAPSLSASHCHFCWEILEGGGVAPDCLDIWWHQQWWLSLPLGWAAGTSMSVTVLPTLQD